MFPRSLINDPKTCVTDNLIGYVQQHTNLSLVPDANIVIRKDFETSKSSGKVQLLSGNGSGHEPGLFGFVGRGMLTACVLGQIFTSPPAQHILTALRMLHNSAGTLCLVANYTGDRLNFGLAGEQAQLEGLSGVEMVVMGEDCAITAPDKFAGRRGLAGIVLAIKIAGAMAEDGCSMNEIISCLKFLQNYMATIGIAISSCIVPNKGPLFFLKSNEYELGIGVHGEAGAAKLKTTTARDVARQMVDHMTLEDSCSRLDLKPRDNVALLVNNLGGLSILEFNIMVKEVLEYLGELRVTVNQLYTSHFFCSLNMAGISFTLLHLNSSVIKCLDAPCDAPAWNQGLTRRTSLAADFTSPPSTLSPPPSTLDLGDDPDSNSVKLTPFGEGLLTKLVSRACLVMNNCELMLNQMDKGAGDGDTGSTLSRGATAILKELEGGRLKTQYPGVFLQQLARLCSTHMGGTSGALYSLLMTGLASGFSEHPSHWLAAWCHGLELGLASLNKYGGASLGDRTMLDALFPFYEALRSSEAQDWPEILAVLEKAAQEAEAGAQRTVGMTARAGRASYVKSQPLCQPDPGAQAVANMARTIYETVKQYLSQPLPAAPPSNTFTLIAD